MNDRCEKCPYIDGCIYPRCSMDGQKVAEEMLVKYALDLLAITNAAAFKLLLPGTTKFVIGGAEADVQALRSETAASIRAIELLRTLRAITLYKGYPSEGIGAEIDDLLNNAAPPGSGAPVQSPARVADASPAVAAPDFDSIVDGEAVPLLKELRIEANIVPHRRGLLYGLAADRIEELETRLSATATNDPGTEKLLRDMLDRAYKMMQMAGYRVVEQDADHNNPIIAWMADARSVLYGGTKPHPDPENLT